MRHMPRGVMLAAVLSLMLASPVSAPGATDQTLPAETARGLAAATGPEDIARLVAAHPALAATILSEAAVLGIASPAQVVAVMAQDLDPQGLDPQDLDPQGLDPQVPGSQVLDLAALVRAAVEAAPGEADITARAALEASDALPAEIAAAAVDGIEDVRPALDTAAVRAEAAEILAMLGRAAPDRIRAIAVAIAAATDTPLDDAGTLLAAAARAGIETADAGPPGPAGPRPGLPGRVPFFVELPSQSQASPN